MLKTGDAGLRRLVMMLNWPCPREYAPTKDARKEEKKLKPEDLSHEELLQAIESCLPNNAEIDNIMIAREPHKRRQPNPPYNVEWHYHCAIQMKRPACAHIPIARNLARKGIAGWFSFCNDGYAPLVQYLHVPSAKKPATELDPEPLIKGFVPDDFLKYAYEDGELERPKTKRQRKDKFTPDKLMKIMADNGLDTLTKLQNHAFQLSLNDDNDLFNYLMAIPRKAREELFQDIRRMIDPNANFDAVTMIRKSKYNIEDFDVPHAIQTEIDNWDRKKTCLVLFGDPCTGKTSLASTLLGTDFHLVRQIDQLKEIDWAGTNGSGTKWL